jgi:membrane protease YdiL (CAAX protease family)
VGVFFVLWWLVLLIYPAPHSSFSFIHSLQNLVLILPFGPLWEEIAWRGYALEKLQMHYSRLSSALRLGVFWGIWHIPLWTVTLHLHRNTVVPVLVSGLASIISWSVIFSIIYNGSRGSLPVVILLHATHLTASDQAFATLQRGQLSFVELSAVLSVCLATALVKIFRFSGRHTVQPPGSTT